MTDRAVLAGAQGVDKKQLVDDVRKALYASKICSYAQGMNIIKAKSAEMEWDVDLGALARIWKVRWGRRAAVQPQSACAVRSSCSVPARQQRG